MIGVIVVVPDDADNPPRDDEQNRHLRHGGCTVPGEKRGRDARMTQAKKVDEGQENVGDGQDQGEENNGAALVGFAGVGYRKDGVVNG